MVITIFPIVILVAGLLMWAISKNGIVVKAGEYMFFCGLLVLTFVSAKTTWQVGALPVDDAVTAPA